MEIIEPYHGKWFNVPCNQKNLVVCQKNQNWLFSYLQKTVMELRESFDNLTKQSESNKQDLENEIKRKTTESTPPGTIAYFSNISAPKGWIKANGQTVSRITYASLFATIGTTYGSGDGSTTFTLPDLRGEFIRGWSDGRDVDKDRSFGSFQWGSNIPFSGQINNNWTYAPAVGYNSRWDFAGLTFDDGFEYNVQSGETRDGTTFPNKSDNFQNQMPYIPITNQGFITSWNVLKGTRPRNIALLACIKY